MLLFGYKQDPHRVTVSHVHGVSRDYFSSDKDMALSYDANAVSKSELQRATREALAETRCSERIAAKPLLFVLAAAATSGSF